MLEGEKKFAFYVLFSGLEVNRASVVVTGLESSGENARVSMFRTWQILLEL